MGYTINVNKNKAKNKKGIVQMNIIKVLENQIAKRNEHIDLEGNILSLEQIKKRSLKDYNALVKTGDIDPMEKSFKEYFYDDLDQYLPVDCLIDFIRGGTTFVATDDIPEVESEKQKPVQLK